MSLILAILLSSAAAFDTRTIPLTQDGAEVFVFPRETGSMRSILVQEGSTLISYALAGNSQPKRAVLPEGATAFNVADLDGDQQLEVIAVAGKRVLRIPLSTEPSPPERLFENDGILSRDTGIPYLYPLIVSISDRQFIALPNDTQLNLYNAKGESAGQIPLKVNEDNSSYTHPRATDGSRKELVWSIWQRVELVADFPQDGYYSGATLPDHTQAIFARPTSEESALEWPWFPIRKSGDDILKAHFSWSGDLRQETRISIQSLGPKAIEEEAKGEGDILRYPGILVSSWDPPDFNGDGYGDILLSRIPEPGASLGALVRTLTNGTWPMEMSLHLYLPDKHRFDPRSPSLTTFRVDVTSLFDRRPFKAISLRDLNGDGRTDLGLVPDDNHFLVWLCGPEGFAKEPDYTLDFPEPFVEVESDLNYGSKANAYIVLRTQHSLIVLLYSNNE